MSNAVRFHELGGPEVLELEEVEVGDPGPGEARIRHTAIGVNFIDVYQRTGVYLVPLPAVGGNEGAGVVEAVGPGVIGVAVGDRVAYTSVPGSYCEARLVPADRLLKLPAHITDETAAAILLKGLTVQYLIHTTYAVKPGETVLWHAAAGGVGLIACEWLRAMGVSVIATVGSDDKMALAREHGAAEVINYRTEDVVTRVKASTDGKGVPVVYDSIGRDTWERSLDCLRPRGLMVSFGNASGVVPPFSVGTLASKGSLYVTRPTLATYIATRAELMTRAESLFEAVRTGQVRMEPPRRYKLADAQAAHRDLEARRTTGSLVLIP